MRDFYVFVSCDILHILQTYLGDLIEYRVCILVVLGLYALLLCLLEVALARETAVCVSFGAPWVLHIFHVISVLLTYDMFHTHARSLSPGDELFNGVWCTRNCGAAVALRCRLPAVAPTDSMFARCSGQRRARREL